MDRRAVIAGGGSGWAPSVGLPTAWFYAASTYVTLSGANVSSWADRSGNGNDIGQGSAPSQPTWEASGGWSGAKSSLLFAAQSLNSVSGQLLTVFSGSNKPVTVLATCQPTSYANALTVCSWDDTLITARQNFTLTTSQFASCKRTDDAGGSTTSTSSGPLVGTGHVRLGYVFTGDGFNAYVDGVSALSVSALAFGNATFSRFRLGDGPEVGPDSFTGRFVEVVIYPRALSAAEVALYNTYSVNEWG